MNLIHVQESIGFHEPFRGFALPTSNTTYTPNQFFDVCLNHCSRGCVRLVAFLIRKTLGWCDAEGNPQSELHLVSYSDFEQAGISRAKALVCAVDSDAVNVLGGELRPVLSVTTSRTV